MASRALFVLSLLALPFLLDARLAPLLAILKGSRQFISLRKLITRESIEAITDYLMSSRDGLTIFAPTDDAFDKLPGGSLGSLTTEEKTRLVLLHVLPVYLNYDSLYKAASPLPTLASEFSLNLTSSNEQVTVTAGLGTSRVISSFYEEFPYAIFRVDAVLITPDLAAAKSPAAPPV